MDIRIEKGAEGALGKTIKPWKYRTVRMRCPHCHAHFSHKLREEASGVSMLKALMPLALGSMLTGALGGKTPLENSLAGFMAGKAIQKQVDKTIDLAIKGKRKKK